MVKVNIYKCDECPNCKSKNHNERTFICSELEAVLYDYHSLNENCPFKKYDKVYTYLVSALFISLVINIMIFLYTI